MSTDLGSIMYTGRVFKRIHRLGRGSFGDAILIESPCQTERLVCKEIYYGSFCDDPESRLKSFEQELKLLRISAHPNIVQLFDFRQDAAIETAHIFMEYCAEGDLSKFIQDVHAGERQLTENMTWKMIFQLAAATAYCHHGLAISQGRFMVKRDSWEAILHRDIKPANVLLSTKDGGEICVKLCDFGVGKLYETEMTGTYVGTREYHPPEITRDTSYWTMKADLYALGRTIEKLTKHCKFSVIDDLVKKCLSETPKDRPSSLTLLEIAGSNVNRLANVYLHTNRPESFSNPNNQVISPCNVTGWEDCLFSTIVEVGSLDEPQERSKSGPFRRLRLLMEDGGDVITKAPMGNTPLHEAAETGNYVLAQRLLELGAKPNAENFHKRTALFLAAERGYGKLCKLLLDYNGTLHGEALQAMFGLDAIFSEQGQLQEAKAMFLSDLEAKSRALGSEHPGTVRTIYNLKNNPPGNPAFTNEFKQSAAKSNASTISRFPNLDESFARGGMTKQEVDALCANDRNFAIMYADYQTKLRARWGLLGPDNEDTLKTIEVLATLYQRQGKFQAAEMMKKEVEKRRTKTLGEDSEETVAMRSNPAQKYELRDGFLVRRYLPGGL